MGWTDRQTDTRPLLYTNAAMNVTSCVTT